MLLHKYYLIFVLFFLFFFSVWWKENWVWKNLRKLNFYYPKLGIKIYEGYVWKITDIKNSLQIPLGGV